MLFMTEAASRKVNDLFETLQKRFGLWNFTDQTTGFIRNFTQVEVLLVEGSIAAETWRENARVGAIISSVAISIFLFFFFVIPNFYLLLKRIKLQQPAFVSKVDWPYKSAKMYK
jgi:hypothetical protein